MASDEEILAISSENRVENEGRVMKNRGGRKTNMAVGGKVSGENVWKRKNGKFSCFHCKSFVCVWVCVGVQTMNYAFDVRKSRKNEEFPPFKREINVFSLFFVLLLIAVIIRKLEFAGKFCAFRRRHSNLCMQSFEVFQRFSFAAFQPTPRFPFRLPFFHPSRPISDETKRKNVFWGLRLLWGRECC
jgi:hypothetical protein